MSVSAQKQVIAANVTEEGILCRDLDGREVKIGGGGPRATDLLLMAVAGCSGATLNALLKRDGWEARSFRIKVEGERSQDRPRRFAEIYVKYELECQGLSRDKLEEYLVITERTCPVIQSLNSRIHLSAELESTECSG